MSDTNASSAMATMSELDAAAPVPVLRLPTPQATPERQTSTRATPRSTPTRSPASFKHFASPSSSQSQSLQSLFEFCTVDNIDDSLAFLTSQLSSAHTGAGAGSSVLQSLVATISDTTARIGIINFLYPLIGQLHTYHSNYRTLTDQYQSLCLTNARNDLELLQRSERIAEMDKKLYELESKIQQHNTEISTLIKNHKREKTESEKRMTMLANKDKQYKAEIRKRDLEIEKLMDKVIKLMNKEFKLSGSNFTSAKPSHSRNSTIDLTHSMACRKGVKVNPSATGGKSNTSTNVTSDSGVSLIDKSDLAAENKELRLMLQTMLQSLSSPPALDDDDIIDENTNKHILNVSTSTNISSDSEDVSGKCQWLNSLPLSMIRSRIETETKKRMALLKHSVYTTIQSSLALSSQSVSEPLTPQPGSTGAAASDTRTNTSAHDSQSAAAIAKLKSELSQHKQMLAAQELLIQSKLIQSLSQPCLSPKSRRLSLDSDVAEREMSLFRRERKMADDRIVLDHEKEMLELRMRELEKSQRASVFVTPRHDRVKTRTLSITIPATPATGHQSQSHSFVVSDSPFITPHCHCSPSPSTSSSTLQSPLPSPLFGKWPLTEPNSAVGNTNTAKLTSRVEAKQGHGHSNSYSSVALASAEYQHSEKP